MFIRLTAMIISVIVLLSAFLAPQPNQSQANIFNPSKLRSENEKVWLNFNHQFDNKWQVTWNKDTGTPQRISGHRILLDQEVTKDNVAAVSIQVLERYKSVLQVAPSNLALQKTDFQPPKAGGTGSGTWYIYYRQVYSDLPVVGGSVRLVIRDRKVTTMGADYYPGISVTTTPKIQASNAVSSVIRGYYPDQNIKAVNNVLLIYPENVTDGIQYHLAWEITMPTTFSSTDPAGFEKNRRLPEKPGQGEKTRVRWRFYVDAITGKVIYRTNLLYSDDFTFNGNVSGQIRRSRPLDQPENVPIAHMTVILSKNENTYKADADLKGDYNITKIKDAGEKYYLQATLGGPFVQLHNAERLFPDTTSVGDSPVYAQVPGTHNWILSEVDTSPNQVETNAFYHVNVIHDWFDRDPPDPPFSLSPLSRPVQVYVRDGKYCNAFAEGTGGLRFGSGDTNQCSDYALCSDIIYHEYTHLIIHSVYENDWYFDWFRTMNEGWADYFACSFTNDSWLGEGCSKDGLRNIGEGRKYPMDWVGQEHNDGMILSGAIWHTRRVLGSDLVDRLALSAIKQMTFSFKDYLGALLEEDDDPVLSNEKAANNDLSDGTPHIKLICESFYNIHGIYNKYCGGYTSSPIADISSPDPRKTAFNTYSSNVTIEGTAFGSSQGSLNYFTLQYRKVEGTSGWSTSGIYLSHDGKQAINEGVLGIWDTSQVGEGRYELQLVVKDDKGNVNSAVTTLIIDHLLKPGWPVLAQEHFSSSPAITDIDKSYNGLEIIAVSDSGNLYVIHSDGTIAEGWPMFIGKTDVSVSPSIGDVDGDGKLEIVVSYTVDQRGTITVFDNKGNIKSGWPKKIDKGYEFSGAPVLADLNGDHKLEIIICSTDFSIYTWSYDGKLLPGWPQFAEGRIYSSPAVGDLDRDGDLEILVGADDKTLYAWHHNGKSVSGQHWPQVINSLIRSGPVLGDIDNDGYLEVIACTFDGGVYVWNHNGSILNGWPKQTNNMINFPASPVLGDIDGDCRLDIIVMDNSNSIHAWNSTGMDLQGWPTKQTEYDLFVSSPVLADADGFKGVEVIAELGGDPGTIIAYDHTGKKLINWPKYIPSGVNSSPSVADLDGDGKIELVVGSKGIFVWQLTKNKPGYEKSLLWPTYRQNNQRTGRQSAKYSISPKSKVFPNTGGEIDIEVVNHPYSCDWSAVNDLNWINILAGQAGYGNGSVKLNARPNFNVNPRSGDVSIANQTFYVSQSGTSNAELSCPGSVKAKQPLKIGMVFTNGDCAKQITIYSLTIRVEILDDNNKRVNDTLWGKENVMTFNVSHAVPMANCQKLAPGVSKELIVTLIDKVPVSLIGKRIAMNITAKSHTGASFKPSKCVVDVTNGEWQSVSEKA